MKRTRKRPLFAACLLVMLQVFTAVFSLLMPIHVSAGEQLGETDFDSGKGLPWHIMESATGKMEFEIEDGVYRITIVNPGGASNGGDDRWDCQFRHRGLTIVSGHTYHVHYEIKASNSGKYYTKIGNLAGDVEVWHNMSNGWDLDATWDPLYIDANQWKIVDLEFTANQSIDVAEWAFHLGGDGQYTNGVCFPAGTVIEFDNMSLVDKTSDENDYVQEIPWERATILTNQIGYIPGLAKKATLLSDSRSSVGFSVLDQSGNEVFSGKSEPFGEDKDSGDNVHILDFSSLDTPGIYSIVSDDGGKSRDFSISITSDLSSLLYDSLNYFYQNRSGIEIRSEYISSGDVDSLSRAAGHTNDNANVLNVWGYSGSESANVTGGWYDAGDHGKYVVNGGISLWLMQNMYELALHTGMESVYADGTMLIPENSNSYPDLLDEARWEMELMLKMQVENGDCAGMAYHKVADIKWTGLAVAPADDPQERVLYPPTTAATLNLAACAAQSARLWAGMDNDFSSICREAAIKAYDAAMSHPDMYAPMENTEGSGAYGDDNVKDEFYWAACELFITTGDSKYLNDIKNSDYFCGVSTEMSGGESVDSAGSFDWGHTASLGTLSLLISRNLLSASELENAKKGLYSAADAFLSMEDKQGYGLPYKQSTLSNKDSFIGYQWGSNSFVLDNGIIMAYAYLESGDEKYLNGAVSAMDYILGRNANDYSYVTGYGTHAAKYPHHRYWANLIDNSFPVAPAGVLVGGPNSGMEDPWVRGMGWKKGEIAPAKCYLDHIEAYSANECAINWNASLAWMTAFIAGNSEGIIAGSHGGGSAQPAVADPGTASQTVVTQTTVTPQQTPVTANTAADTGTASNTPSYNSNTSSGDMAGVLKAAIIVFGIVAVVIPTEIFIYKLVKLKKEEKNKE